MVFLSCRYIASTCFCKVCPNMKAIIRGVIVVIAALAALGLFLLLGNLLLMGLGVLLGVVFAILPFIGIGLAVAIVIGILWLIGKAVSGGK